MIKNLLFLVLAIAMVSCTQKPHSLAGRQFHLVDPTLKKAPGIVQITFVNEHTMQIAMIRDMLNSNNSLVVGPYEFENDHLTFRGATYDVRKNNKGYDLYRSDQLVYKLIIPKGDELGDMAKKSPYSSKPPLNSKRINKSI